MTAQLAQPTTWSSGIILRPAGAAYAEVGEILPLILLRARAALQREQVVPCGKPRITYLPASQVGDPLFPTAHDLAHLCYGIMIDVPIRPLLPT